MERETQRTERRHKIEMLKDMELKLSESKRDKRKKSQRKGIFNFISNPATATKIKV